MGRTIYHLPVLPGQMKDQMKDKIRVEAWERVFITYFNAIETAPFPRIAFLQGKTEPCPLRSLQQGITPP